MPCMPFPQCSQLTADSSHNSYFQQCKCSVLTRCIEEGEGVENWMPLKQTHWPNRFQRGQSLNTPLKQAHLVKQVDNAIAMIFVQIWFGFWFCWYWTSCSSTRANSQLLSSLFGVSAQLLSHSFWCCSFCQSRFDASDSFCQSWFVASGLFKFRVSGSSYLTSSADDKRKDELRIMSRPCIERIIWVWVD